MHVDFTPRCGFPSCIELCTSTVDACATHACIECDKCGVKPTTTTIQDWSSHACPGNSLVYYCDKCGNECPTCDAPSDDEEVKCGFADCDEEATRDGVCDEHLCRLCKEHAALDEDNEACQNCFYNTACPGCMKKPETSSVHRVILGKKQYCGPCFSKRDTAKKQCIGCNAAPKAAGLEHCGECVKAEICTGCTKPIGASIPTSFWLHLHNGAKAYAHNECMYETTDTSINENRPCKTCLAPWQHPCDWCGRVASTEEEAKKHQVLKSCTGESTYYKCPEGDDACYDAHCACPESAKADCKCGKCAKGGHLTPDECIHQDSACDDICEDCYALESAKRVRVE